MPWSPNPQPLGGRAPCDDCELFRHCKMRLEACEAFVLFVHGEREKRWRLVPREPRRELYVTLLVRRVDRVRGRAA